MQACREFVWVPPNQAQENWAPAFQIFVFYIHCQQLENNENAFSPTLHAPIDIYPSIVGRLYTIPINKFNWYIFPNVYICIGHIQPCCICVHTSVFVFLSKVEHEPTICVWGHGGPNLLLHKFSQFAAKKCLGPNLPAKIDKIW